MRKLFWPRLLLLIVVTLTIGMLSSIFSGNMKDLYSSLIKPPLAPPAWFFGIVWSVLYLLMAIAADIIYREESSPRRNQAIGLYWLQLVVNFLWSIIFFRLELYWLAVVNIILLDVCVLVVFYRFSTLHKLAALFLVPYLLWILFASYLNIAIAILNP